MKSGANGPNSEIARECHVSAMFVGKLRESLTINVYSENDAANDQALQDDANDAGEPERTYRTKHGTVADNEHVQHRQTRP